jgi:phenylalanyl-tRNA synthetase beta subunit
MVELGQPMHAQDISKMEKPEIVIRRAKRDEEITTLLGQTIKLNSNNFVLTQNGKATVLGGIVGTNLTSVDDNTTDIVLDAGNYDQVNIRKSSRELKIQNETVLRYDKFLHPKLAEIAIERATKLILELAGGEYFQNVDYYPKPVQPKRMNLRFSRVKQVSGMDINGNRIEMTLSSLDYGILERTDEYIQVEIPYFRTDIEVEDDIVSDVLRINNYKNIPSGVMSQAIPPEITPRIYKFEDKLKDILVGLGLNEHITNPLTLSKKDNDTQIKLENSFSSDKTALRTNFKPNLELLIENYKKHKIGEIGVFEIGHLYSKKPLSSNYDDFKEFRKVCVMYSNEKFSPVEISKETKKILSSLLKTLEIFDESYKECPGGTEILVNDIILGQLEYNYILLDTENLLRVSKSPNRSRVQTTIPNYRMEDISLIVPIKQKNGGIFSSIKNFNSSIKNVEIMEEFYDKSIGDENKSVLIRIYYEGDLTPYKDNLIKLLEAKYQVKVRS